MNLNLDKKKALVMGSSEGIGKEIAKSFIKENVITYLNGRDEGKLIKTKKEIGAAGYIRKDLNIPGSGKEIILDTLKISDQLDILVTNTGGPQKNNFLETSSSQWEKDFNGLWMSTVESIKEILPYMIKNKFGRIIMITSVAGREPMAGLTTSNGFRAGLLGLCKSLSNEFAKFGPTINVIMPGFTNTDRLKALNLSENYIKELVPAGRIGEPEEIANLVTFLSSEKASYITGQAIAVDGGYLKSI